MFILSTSFSMILLLQCLTTPEQARLQTTMTGSF